MNLETNTDIDWPSVVGGGESEEGTASALACMRGYQEILAAYWTTRFKELNKALDLKCAADG